MSEQERLGPARLTRGQKCKYILYVTLEETFCLNNRKSRIESLTFLRKNVFEFQTSRRAMHRGIICRIPILNCVSTVFILLHES